MRATKLSSSSVTKRVKDAERLIVYAVPAGSGRWQPRDKQIGTER